MANLIIYYSRRGENFVGGALKQLIKGNTEVVAEYIQNAVGGNLFQIETVRDYPLSCRDCVEEAKRELECRARPELRWRLDSLDGFENIFVCGPCWWGTYPMAMFTQLETLDWTGKNVFPLMTHEGSGLGSCVRDLQSLCQGAAFGTALAVAGHDAAQSEAQVAAWAKSQVHTRQRINGSADLLRGQTF